MIVRLFLVLVAVLSLPRLASAQVFTLYDAFTGPLSPVLWAGLETNTNFAVVSNTETRRAVVQPDPLVPNRFLQLASRPLTRVPASTRARPAKVVSAFASCARTSSRAMLQSPDSAPRSPCCRRR